MCAPKESPKPEPMHDVRSTGLTGMTLEPNGNGVCVAQGNTIRQCDNARAVVASSGTVSGSTQEEVYPLRSHT
jgi:hypothetical protein